MKRREKDQEEKEEEVYKKAILEFTKKTIHDPSFFQLSNEEQKQLALKEIEKAKKSNK